MLFALPPLIRLPLQYFALRAADISPMLSHWLRYADDIY